MVDVAGPISARGNSVDHVSLEHSPRRPRTASHASQNLYGKLLRECVKAQLRIRRQVGKHHNEDPELKLLQSCGCQA